MLQSEERHLGLSERTGVVDGLVMGFKENLKSELEYKGMLVKELAQKSGIKKQTLDNYLSTHNTIPNAEVAVKIAHALGTTVEYLITGKSTVVTDSRFLENVATPEINEIFEKYKSLSAEKKSALMHIVRVL